MELLLPGFVDGEELRTQLLDAGTRPLELLVRLPVGGTFTHVGGEVRGRYADGYVLGDGRKVCDEPLEPLRCGVERAELADRGLLEARVDVEDEVGAEREGDQDKGVEDEAQP